MLPSTTPAVIRYLCPSLVVKIRLVHLHIGPRTQRMLSKTLPLVPNLRTVDIFDCFLAGGGLCVLMSCLERPIFRFQTRGWSMSSQILMIRRKLLQYNNGILSVKFTDDHDDDDVISRACTSIAEKCPGLRVPLAMLRASRLRINFRRLLTYCWIVN